MVVSLEEPREPVPPSVSQPFSGSVLQVVFSLRRSSFGLAARPLCPALICYEQLIGAPFVLHPPQRSIYLVRRMLKAAKPTANVQRISQAQPIS